MHRKRPAVDSYAHKYVDICTINALFNNQFPFINAYT